MTYPNYSEEEQKNNAVLDAIFEYLWWGAMILLLVILGLELVGKLKQDSATKEPNMSAVRMYGNTVITTTKQESTEGKKSFTIEPNKQHTFDNPDGTMAKCYDKSGNLWVTGSGQSKVTVDVQLTCYY